MQRVEALSAASKINVEVDAMYTPTTRRRVSQHGHGFSVPCDQARRPGCRASARPAQARRNLLFAGKEHTLDDLLTRSRTQGFLVIKDGKIIDERYFDGANDKSKFTSWSVAKS